VGKSTWLRENFSKAVFFDLLDTRLYLELLRDPGRLEAMVANRPEGSWVVLDEIQRIPILLNEVHRLMENKGWKFALCGSSARKLMRAGVNLLAGRAVTRTMGPFTYKEVGPDFDLQRALEWGCLPSVHFERGSARDILEPYWGTYIKEEIREEGIVRALPPFMRFLRVTGLLNGQCVNGQNIAREAEVPRSTVDGYFAILEDTLLGHLLPCYRPHAKVREQAHPKFYWFDPGVARAAAGLLFDPADRPWMGSAIETLLFHELRVYNQTQEKHRDIFFYRTASGVEIDFVVETRKGRPSSPPHVVCIEVKFAEKWDRKWEKPMRSLSSLSDRVVVDKMFGIYTGQRPYHFDGIDVLPVSEFLSNLHAGKVF
jgi:predicted AAA+ superfamily ATPase